MSTDPRTVPAALDRLAHQLPDHDALITDDRSFTSAVGDELVPGSVVRLDRDADDVAQRRQRRAVQVGHAVIAQESTHPEQHRRTRAGQDVAGFSGRVSGVERHHGGPGVVNRQAGHHPVPGVRRPDGNPVPGPHAQCDEGGRRAVHLVTKGRAARMYGVVDAAVIGVPDERLGEVGRAFIVTRPGAELDEQSVIAYTREHLANFKAPRSVRFVDELPRNAAGEVVKPQLRELA
ncbi:hypothetical protein A9X00_21810 [Mycobacterium sp. 1245805.9]|nr:hypothetical protein A9X00_21810 [Mycobacterium sp. 1245805.9]